MVALCCIKQAVNSIDMELVLPVRDSHRGFGPEVGRLAVSSPRPTPLTYLVVSAAYGITAQIGMELTVGRHPVSLLWPANTLLLATLLLTPVRFWGMMLLAVLPAHFAVEWRHGVPLTMVLSWFISNSCEALIGAGAIRFFIPQRLTFDHLRSMCIFLFCGVLLAPFASSFLDAALVKLNHWGMDSYWEVWRMRFYSNVLASATLGATILTWVAGGPRPKLRPARLAEAGLLVVGLVSVVILVVSNPLEAKPGLMWGLRLYAPWPFLLWSALRFGTRGASTALLLVYSLTIWNIAHPHQPFLVVDEQAIHKVQMFFVVISFALMPLASLLEERENVERDLRVSEERFRGIVESQPDLICRFFADTTLTFVNQSYCRFFQRTPTELIGRKFLELVPTTAHELIMLTIASVITGRRTVVCEHEVLLPQGGVGWHQWINHPIVSEDGQIREIQAIGRDITERRRTEVALRESTEQNQAMLNAIPDSIFLMDKSGVILECQTGDKSLLLIPQARCLGRHVRDVLPRKLAEELQRSGDAVLRNGHTAMEQCALVVRGENRCFESRLVKCGAQRILILVRDVTEQKEAEEALRESEERYREVVDSQTELVSRCKPDTTLTFANEAYCRFFGQTRTDLIGRKLLEFIPDELHAKVVRSMVEVISDRRLAVFEHHFTWPDGITRWVRWANYAILDSDGRVKEIQGIGKDITDRKRAEEARQNLIHASRLAVIGEFTAMMTHEINQPLNAILTNTEAAKELLNEQSVPLREVRAIVRDIYKDILRTRETTNRMRALSQKREMEMKMLDLNRLVEEVVHLASGDALKRHVRIQMEPALNLPLGRGDPIHIQHILMNLILNGMEAMCEVPEAGRVLVIKTEPRNAGELMVSVKDAGHGIPPDMMPRVFEAFFSTKSKGIGLGLSIARTIIHAHRGRLWVEKNPERGVTFCFTLPVAN
jgi:PAS domain S-box-containing protein